jgi:hypothetical protein
MIVRDAGDSWQVVLQTDHADLSADFARRWADRTPRYESLTIATERHDDGWAVWEQAPMVDAESAKPVNFLDVGVLSHLAFYRACIAAVTEQDAYAGLLVSMHGAGIYRRRYGLDESLGLSRAPDVQAEVDAFVAEQEASFPARAAALRASEDERRRDYELLQLYDRLSLYFCMRDVEAGEPGEVQGLALEPLGPWRVRMEPYPLADTPARLRLVRRVLAKQDGWTDDGFRQDFFAAPPETVEIVVEP